MGFLWIVLLLSAVFSLSASTLNFPPGEGDYRHLYPTVCLAIHVYGHEHTVPYVMGMVETLRYPKDQMHIHFILEGENPMVQRWVSNIAPNFYRSISQVPGEGNWRERVLAFGRRKQCPYLLITNTDEFLTQDSLKQLVALNKVVVSPLLYTPFGGRSNVDGLLGQEFIGREKMELIRVYYSKGPLLIQLKHSDASYLTFDAENLHNYHGDGNPIDIFAFSAYTMNIPIEFSNLHFYGYFIDSNSLNPRQHRAMLGTFLANWVSDSGPASFPQSSVLPPWYPIPTKFGFDQIYLINLKRRPERLRKMAEILRLLGVDYVVFEAVDGQNLTERQLAEELRFLPGYQDPFHKRAMKRGEIGCFLSHHKVWEDVVHNDYGRVIVLEDDVRFTENGTMMINDVIEDIMRTRLDWDFIYFGRKKMSAHGDEFFVPTHRYLSTLGYSYWTLGYALTRGGAQKLLNARPLERLLALDEFLPILYDSHPNTEWKSAFSPRDLHAFAVYPVVVEPERYTHQTGYVSDTEGSTVVDAKEF